MGVFNHERTYGIEMEINTNTPAQTIAREIAEQFERDGIRQFCAVEGLSHGTPMNWKIVSDGSVHPGFEIVSPILSGYDGKAQIESVCKALRNFGNRIWNSSQTGLHVHHGTDDLTGQEIGYVFATYSAFQSTFNMMVSPSRRRNRFCQNLDWSLLTSNGSDKLRDHREAVCENILSKMVQLMGNERVARYTTVNICSVFPNSRRMPQGHGTIEFRQHQGSTNAKKIWSWILVTQSLMESSKEKRNYAKPLTATTTQSNRGELNRLQTVCAVIPTYHVRQRNTAQGRRALEPGVVEACTPYMEAYKYFAQRVRNFSRALINENRALPTRRRASDDQDLDE